MGCPLKYQLAYGVVPLGSLATRHTRSSVVVLTIQDAVATRAPSVGIRVGHPKPDAQLRDQGSWLHATVAMRKGK